LNDRWPPRAGPTAVILVAAAVATVLSSWRNVIGLDASITNIVVGLLAVAVTITLVEGIVEREKLERPKPRIEQARLKILLQQSLFLAAVASDYRAKTNDLTFDTSNDALAMLDAWIEHDQATSPNQPLSESMLTLARAFVEKLEDIVDAGVSDHSAR
jgi:hypothetical protein